MAASDLAGLKPFAAPRPHARKIRQPISRLQFRRVQRTAETLADLVTFGLGISFSLLFAHWIPLGAAHSHSAATLASISAEFGLLGALLIRRDSLYSAGGTSLQIRETEHILRATAQTALLAFLICFGLNLSSFTASILIACVLVPILLMCEKLVLLSLIRAAHAAGCGVDEVLIFGDAKAGEQIASVLLGSPRLGLAPVGVIASTQDPRYTPATRACVHGNCSIPLVHGRITAAILEKCRVSILVLTDREMPAEELRAAEQAAKQAGVRIVAATDASSLDPRRPASTTVSDFVSKLIDVPRTRSIYGPVKRGLDIVVSALLLILLVPAFLFIAAMICIDSPGPALFMQKRVGRNGKLFDIYKFRSMHMGTPKYDFSPTSSRDRRITRVGRILRRTSLDELPQLINVLHGSMSLVGPRPEMPFVVETYNSTHRRRLLVDPGITGLWQLSACRSSHIHENIQYDLDYIRDRSFFLDLSILIHTLFFAMRGV